MSEQDKSMSILPDSESAATKSASSRHRANRLDGKAWTRYSISVWSDIRKTPQEVAFKHPAMFPLELPRRLIEIFMGDNDRVVLDPFVGSGSTVLAAHMLGKHGIGIDVSETYSSVARQRLGQKSLFVADDCQCRIHTANAHMLDGLVVPGSVDLVITSPPYWNVLLQKRSADYKPQREYAAGEEDLGKIADYQEFLRVLKGIFGQVRKSMRPGAYCCVIVMDLRKKDRFYPFHSDVASFMQDLGFIYDDIIIWDRRHEYNNMRPLGYPSVFRINKAHEYILLFINPAN